MKIIEYWEDTTIERNVDLQFFKLEKYMTEMMTWTTLKKIEVIK